MSLPLNAIGIMVADMDRAIAFYANLGLEFKGDGQHYECELPGGMRVMLDGHESVKALIPGWEPPAGSARVAFAFQAASPSEVDSSFDRLVAAGAAVVKEPYDAFWGQRYASIHDPDGNILDLYAPQ